jgi:excisionase family DNA binding protein
MSKLLRVNQVAEMLNVQPWRVYELVRQDRLPAVRLGRQVRFHPAELDAWMKAGGSPLYEDHAHAAA